MKVNVYPNLLQSTIKETNMTSIDSIMFVIETYLLYKYIYMNISIIDFFQEFFYSEIKTKILEIKNDKMIMNY